MSFPQTLPDAIPRWPETARSLKLAAITGDCSHTVEFGRAVKLDFRLEETGKLNGVFTVSAGLDIEAARALAATLNELLERAEQMPLPECSGRWSEGACGPDGIADEQIANGMDERVAVAWLLWILPWDIMLSGRTHDLHLYAPRRRVAS